MHLTTVPSAPTTTVTRADLSQLCGNQNFTARCAESSRRPARHRRDACSVDFHAVSHGSEPSFAGLQTPNAFVMDLSTSESNGNAKSNFSWKALFAATASQLTP